jgi:hypothetical protein
MRFFRVRHSASGFDISGYAPRLTRTVSSANDQQDFRVADTGMIADVPAVSRGVDLTFSASGLLHSAAPDQVAAEPFM